MNGEKRLGCVVMASGRARRFGGGKLMAKLGGKSVLAGTLRCVLEQPSLCVRVASIFPEIREEAARCGADTVIPEGPALSDTIRAGLTGAELFRWEGCLFLPGDQPLVRPETIEGMIRLFLEDPKTPVRLSWKGKAASPVLFPSDMFKNLRALKGETGGNSLLGNRTDIRLYEAGCERELWDVDTREDLLKIRQCFDSFSPDNG